MVKPRKMYDKEFKLMAVELIGFNKHFSNINIVKNTTMKKLVITLTAILVCSQLFSQIVTLKEDKIVTGGESVNGFVFNICDDAEFAKDDIKSFLKDRYDLKVKKKNKYTSIVPEAEIPNVSTRRGDLLIYLQHSDTGNIMGMSFVLGYDISLNSADNEEEMGHFRDVAKNFIKYHYNSYYSELIEDLDKQLNSAKKDLHKKETSIISLKKKEMNYDKKLSKQDDVAKKAELEKDIEDLQDEIESTYDLLPALKEQVETLQEKRDKNKQELLVYQSLIKNI